MEEHKNRNVPSDMISFYIRAHTYRKKMLKNDKTGMHFMACSKPKVEVF